MSSGAHGKFFGKRLVIFGCGYVGAALAEHALAEGASVTALTRNSGTAAALRSAGVTTIVADLAGHEWYDAVAPAPDFAVDCVSSGGGGPDGYRQSYVRGMESILRWAGDRGRIGTLVYTSSTSVYGQHDGERVNESAPVGGAGETSDVLVEAERTLTRAPGACERWFILRLAGIYGPGRHYLLEQVRTGTVAGLGDHRLNLAHREDIVSAIMACLAASPSVRNDVFNVADDAPTRKADVVAWLSSQLGLAEPRFTGLPAGQRRAVTPDRVIDNRRIKAALGWRPRFPTFREGYAAILARPT